MSSNLSKLAIKRLQKELKSTPPVGLSLFPEEDDLSRWHANINILDGAYKGCCFHLLICVPDEYPNKAPSAYFRSQISYQNGATQHVEGKGTSICLDLLGNFANYHTEWGNAASGWSPANSLVTVLIQLQGVLNDMLSSSAATVSASKKSAQELKCSCGHDGSQKAKYYPPLSVGEVKPESGNNANDNNCESVEAKCARLEKENAVLKIKADKYDQLFAMFSQLNGGVEMSNVESPKAVEPPAPKVAAPPKLDHLVCYVSGLSAADVDEKEIFGVGVGVNEKNGSLTTSGELLSKSAFDGGVRRSSQNEKIDFFLPIYVSSAHWALAKDVFRKSIADIFKAMSSKQRNNGNSKAPVEVQALLVLCSLMNNACVACSGAGGIAHDNFINSYFSLLRILTWLCHSFPSVPKYATAQVKAFQQGKRNKSSCPNLGEFLILLHASEIKWAEVRVGFLEEVDARNVRWFKNSSLQRLGSVKDRYQLTFAETAMSRQIVCFQVRFLDVSRALDLKTFVDGAAPAAAMKELKEIHAKVKAHKNWNHYMTWIGLQEMTVEERSKELEQAVKLSMDEKYHGGGGGGGGGNRKKRY